MQTILKTPRTTSRDGILLLIGVLGLGLPCWQPGAIAAGFALTNVPVSLDRWMYPFNAAPGTRPAAPTFGSAGDEAGVDTRHGQFLLGWNTSSLIPTNAGPGRYLIRRAAVSVMVKNDLKFALDPTHDSYRTFLPTDHSLHQDDADVGVPVELFGAGFRNGFDDASFLENSAFGSAAPGRRNAYVASYSTNGVFVDVGNNVGKTNELYAPFEAWPFGVGTITNLAAGALVPIDSVMRFEINLSDPLVTGYLQWGLDRGRLRFVLSSLHGASFGGEQSYPDFHTRESLVGGPPMLDLEVTVVSDTDSDQDGLPDDWEQFCFSGLGRLADDDADGDGMTNLMEWLAGTDPTNPSSNLRLTVLGGGTSPQLSFNPSLSRTYTVQSSANLSSWQPAEGALLHAQPGMARWHATDSPATPTFFRMISSPRTNAP